MAAEADRCRTCTTWSIATCCKGASGEASGGFVLSVPRAARLEEVARMADVAPEEMAAIEKRERAELERRARRYRGGRARRSLKGRVALHELLLGTDQMKKLIQNKAKTDEMLKAGMAERAILYMRKALEEGFRERNRFVDDPEFAALQAVPEFQELLKLQPKVL